MEEMPETPAVIQRAYEFHRAWTFRTGEPPRVFPVTWEEYQSLRQLRALNRAAGRPHDWSEYCLFGMQIVLVRDTQAPVEPIEPRATVDSEGSSLEAWAAGVEALVREVRGSA